MSTEKKNTAALGLEMLMPEEREAAWEAHRQREEMRKAGHDTEIRCINGIIECLLWVSNVHLAGRGDTENAATQACYDKWKELE